MFETLAKWIAKRALKYAGVPLRDPALVALFGGRQSSAGVDVTEDTALNVATVWRAVNLLSSSVAMLPAAVYEGEGRTRSRMEDLPAHHLIAESPNPETTPFVFHETLQAHALTWGNGYAQIEWAEPGVPIAMWQMMPDQVCPDRDHATGDVIYRFTAKFPGEVDQILKPEEVLHIPGIGFDGLRGYDVITRAKEGVGLALATELFGAGFFGRGSMPGGVLEHPGDLSEPAKKNLRESWELLHRGPDNAHRVAILDEGMKFSAIGLPPQAAQFLETRQFQVVEIARWFGIPPHMLYDLSNATFSNIEHQGLDFLTYSLLPWLIRWKQEYNRKLVAPSLVAQKSKKRRVFYADFDTHLLLKTDTKTRYEAYGQGRNGGWLTLNNILSRENMDLLPDELGNSRLVPSTMVMIGPDGQRVLAGLDPSHPDHPQHEAHMAAQKSVEQVENTALNGAQVQALQQVVTAVAARQLDPQTAKYLITISVPSADEATIDKMLAPYTGGKDPTPAAATAVKASGVVVGD